MWSAVTVFLCALELLGRTQHSFPPVELVEEVPPGVSPLATGYALPAEKRIVLITSTAAFRQARQARDRCSDVEAIRDIAGVLAHEEWHLKHGADEEGAYDAQLVALLAVGANANSQVLHKVMRAKLMVVAASKRTTRARVTADPSTRVRQAASAPLADRRTH